MLHQKDHGDAGISVNYKVIWVSHLHLERSCSPLSCSWRVRWPRSCLPRWRLESSCRAEQPWKGILKLLGSDSDTQFTDKISVNSKGILLNYLHGDIWWKWNPRPSRSRVVDISSDLCWDVLSSKHLRVVYGTEALRPFNNKPRVWPQACCQFDKAPSLVVVRGHVHMTVQMTYKHGPYITLAVK